MVFDEKLDQIVDTASIVTMVATFAGWLPAIAALLTILWTAVRIYESPTIQKFFLHDPPDDESGGLTDT